MIKSEVDELVERTERRVKAAEDDDGRITSRRWARRKSSIAKNCKPTAEVRLKRGLALTSSSSRKDLSVSDEEVEQQIDRMAAAYGPQSKEARKALSQPQNAREAIKIDLLTQAGLKRLMAICKGEADKPAEEPAAA